MNWPEYTLPPLNLWSMWSVDESPCVGKCGIEGGACKGCGRTLDEIADWSLMDAKERAAVNRRLRDE